MIGVYVRRMNGHNPPTREDAAQVLAGYSGLTEEEAAYIADGFRILVHRHRMAFIIGAINRIVAVRNIMPEVLGEPAEDEIAALAVQAALRR